MADVNLLYLMKFPEESDRRDKVYFLDKYKHRALGICPLPLGMERLHWTGRLESTWEILGCLRRDENVEEKPEW